MRALKLLVGLLAGALLLSGCGSFSVYNLPMPGGPDAGSNAMTVDVQFQDVLDLVPQSTVKLDDVNVGKVQKIWLKDGVANVQMKLRDDTKLPTNVRAEIEQSSLLGEKYISLEKPDEAAPTYLATGSTIPLSQTGRNPEVEEVLGALSLLLNGGGVAQLKTISTELNKALAGREDSARSVLTELNTLVTQLDNNKAKIVKAISAVDALTKETHRQMGSIDAALDELPSAISSIDKQRADLVKMLKALDQLGATGVHVIKLSKDNTIQIVKELSPVLENLADAGDNFVKSFNTLLTYPFVDAAVGTTPQAARNLHMGDFVNLDITLDLNLDTLQQLPGAGSTVCLALSTAKQKAKSLTDLLKLDPSDFCEGAATKLDDCQQAIEKSLAGDSSNVQTACSSVVPSLVDSIVSQISTILGADDPTAACKKLLGALCGGATTSAGGLNLLGLNRAPASSGNGSGVTLTDLDKSYDPGLVSLLVPALSTSHNTHVEGAS